MDNSRLFLFAALIFVSMLMWQQWQADYAPKPAPSPQLQSENGDVIGDLEPLPVDDLPDQADEVGAAASSAETGAEPAQPKTAVQQLIQVDTDVMQAQIDTRGGVIRSLKLKKYPTSLEQPDDWLELVHSDRDSAYILQSGYATRRNWRRLIIAFTASSKLLSSSAMVRRSLSCQWFGKKTAFA